MVSTEGQATPPEDNRGPGESVWESVESQVHEWEAQVREANERIDRAAGRPLWAAIVVGVVLGGLLLASVLIHPLIFSVVIAVLQVLAVWELVSALRVTGAKLSRVGLGLLALGVSAGAYLQGAQGLILGFGAALVVALVFRLAATVAPSYRDGLRTDMPQGLLVLGYLGILPSTAIALATTAEGPWWIISVMIAVVAIDTTAYAVGRAMGRNKLAPAISPGKTWEGLAGATLAGMVAGGAVGVLLLGIGAGWGVVFGLAMVVTATGGDLVESLIKRELGVKDMSTLLPGHGGVLDRLDSAMPSVALAWVLSFLL